MLESMMAPPYFSHIRYGLYYPDLVIPDAQTYGFDPLFVFSVIRQESLFEGFINSNAGARGLMQLMPGTARDLGVTRPYDPDENIRGGVAYLRALLDRLLTPRRAVRLAQVNIHEVLERVRSLVQAEFPSGISVLRNYDPSVPDLVGDIEQLIQPGNDEHLADLRHHVAQL